jgi:hypothetical protein
MAECIILSPTATAGEFRNTAGQILTPPPGWNCLPPGDAGLTRRVKAAGPSWQVVEKRRNKTFSLGLWAPAENILAARAALDLQRATPQYARRRKAERVRRDVKQEQYVGEFSLAVLQFLDFAPAWSALAIWLAGSVAEHATPVGSGTVARTERIPIEKRAEAAVIAWLRHQTTAYDNMKIARVKGLRREVRRELADASRELLQLHRRDSTHPVDNCPLCELYRDAREQQE